MRVRILVGDGAGWREFIVTAPDDAADACYALPKQASRAKFWSQFGVEIPDGRVLVWEILP